MAARPLNDDEVLNEMNKMVSFIKQEANEKAREIKVKADEEFAIEKAKLVKQETSAIDAQYEKKKKGAEVAQKIAQSTQTNKSRLKLLQAREALLQDLFDATRDQIVTLSKDEGRYGQLLTSPYSPGLELYYGDWGTLQMMEPAAYVQCRKKDAGLAKRAADAAAGQFKEISGREVTIQIQADLNDEGAGGVKLTSGDSRIKIDNSLDERFASIGR